MRYVQQVQIRWSDLDPNAHVRHSVYYDWGAACRIAYFHEQGLTTEMLMEKKIGPILFREECVFRKEIKFGDLLTIDLHLVKANKDFSRWTIRHQLMKNESIIAAVLTVDGSWINNNQRKITAPPEEARTMFEQIPREADFEWM